MKQQTKNTIFEIPKGSLNKESIIDNVKNQLSIQNRFKLIKINDSSIIFENKSIRKRLNPLYNTNVYYISVQEKKNKIYISGEFELYGFILLIIICIPVLALAIYLNFKLAIGVIIVYLWGFIYRYKTSESILKEIIVNSIPTIKSKKIYDKNKCPACGYDISDNDLECPDCELNLSK